MEFVWKQLNNLNSSQSSTKNLYSSYECSSYDPYSVFIHINTVQYELVSILNYEFSLYDSWCVYVFIDKKKIGQKMNLISFLMYECSMISVMCVRVFILTVLTNMSHIVGTKMN